VTEYRGMSLQLPEGDPEFRPYFEAAAEGRLAVRRCSACGLLRFPPGWACPWCNALESVWEPLSGLGTIYSYEIVSQAIQPGFRDWVPYPVLLVELDEQRGVPSGDDGLRLIANLVTPDFSPEPEDGVAIGARVRAVFQPIGDGLALPQFALSHEPVSGLWRFTS
jgi:uncharacterized OB-fold protein